MKKWYALLEQKNMDNAITEVVCGLLSKSYNDEKRAEKALKEILANDKIYHKIQNSPCEVICILAENDFI